jgi:glucokinase
MTALRVIGDIGGTYARFAVAERGKYRELQHLSVSKYATLKDALGEYLDALPRDMRPTRGALAVAGPVSGDEVKLTNLNWTFSIAALKADLNMCSLVVVNDFAATAMSVPYLPEADCYAIGQPQPKTSGPVGIIGPGTALMMASTSRCIASSSWSDSAVRTLETMARILLRWLVFSPLSSRFK